MWSDVPVHREFAARPPLLPAESNRYRVHNPAAPASFTDTASVGSNYLKPRPERACDLCRRRKTKCDGPSAPDNVCSNCAQNNHSCTYLCAYMHVPPSLHVSHLPSANSLVREVPQKRPYPTPILSVSGSHSPLLQLCLQSRGPSGEDGSTAQEGAYHESLHHHVLLNPNHPSPSCARRSISLNTSVHPLSGTHGSLMDSHRPRLQDHLARKTVTRPV